VLWVWYPGHQRRQHQQHQSADAQRAARPPTRHSAPADSSSRRCHTQAFVIKNLDTGLEMNIDDFDRLAHIAADEAEQPVRCRRCGGACVGWRAVIFMRADLC
jgi:hypothetical protein